MDQQFGRTENMPNELHEETFGIDVTQPPEGHATTLAVRNNFTAIANTFRDRLVPLEEEVFYQGEIIENLDRQIQGIPLRESFSPEGFMQTVLSTPSAQSAFPWYLNNAPHVRLWNYTHMRIEIWTGPSNPGGSLRVVPIFSENLNAPVSSWSTLSPPGLQLLIPHSDSYFVTAWEQLDPAQAVHAYLSLATIFGDDATNLDIRRARCLFQYWPPEP